jgi:predicted RNA-binding Zn-ribbon protein involved in translation (DUF1610 family)
VKDYSFKIFCSNCRIPLLDVMVHPGETVTKLRALCPHCGDKSFWKEIKGQFALSYTEQTELGKIETVENMVEVTCHKR